MFFRPPLCTLFRLNWAIRCTMRKRSKLPNRHLACRLLQHNIRNSINHVLATSWTPFGLLCGRLQGESVSGVLSRYAQLHLHRSCLVSARTCHHQLMLFSLTRSRMWLPTNYICVSSAPRRLSRKKLEGTVQTDPFWTLMLV